MIPQELINEIRQNALFVINHSGGKDSQAMMIKLLEFVPKEQIL
ncbi:phosphoadenosine phosphosulfate reductase, partial [Acinetobacter baumannii]